MIERQELIDLLNAEATRQRESVAWDYDVIANAVAGGVAEALTRLADALAARA